MNKFIKIVSIIASSRYFTPALLLVLFFLNIHWFHGLQSRTIMGDDLVNWNYYTETPNFFDSVVENHQFSKYRPVFNLFEFALFGVFSNNMELFFYFNLLVNFIILITFFLLVKKLTKSNAISFSFSLLYLTARFSYYNILQITGLLEALSLLLLILIVYVSVLYIIKKRITFLYWLFFLNLLIVFTHERFIALLPFIIAIIYFGEERTLTLKKTWFLFALAALPLLLNIFLKKEVFGINFFEGTAGTAISINIYTIYQFFRDGLLNIVGFNIGPEHLSAISFNNLDILSKVTSWFIFSIIIYVFAISIIKLKNEKKSAQIIQFKILCIWILLVAPLLLCSSVTIRQEFRWLYAPYIVFLVYLAYLISITFNSKLKYLVVFIFVVLNLFNNIGYRKYTGNIFFIYSAKISDSFYNESIKKYGCKNRDFIIEKFDSSSWVLPSDLFLKPYACHSSLIKYVDNVKSIDLNNIDKNRTTIYKLNWKERRMEILR